MEKLALSVFLFIYAQGYFENTPAAQLICVPTYQQLLSRTVCRYDIATFLSLRPLTGQKFARLRNILISPCFVYFMLPLYKCVGLFLQTVAETWSSSKSTVTTFVSYLLVLETGRLKDQLGLVRLLEQNVRCKNQSFKVTYWTYNTDA